MHLPGPSVPNIAEKLTGLIDCFRHPSGRIYSDLEIAEAVGCSDTLVWQLRTGRRPNPTVKTLSGLAEFFGVQLGYFGADSTVADALADAGVAHLATRAHGLSDQSIKTVLAVVEKIRELEYPNG